MNKNILEAHKDFLKKECELDCGDAKHILVMTHNEKDKIELFITDNPFTDCEKF